MRRELAAKGWQPRAGGARRRRFVARKRQQRRLGGRSPTAKQQQSGEIAKPSGGSPKRTDNNERGELSPQGTNNSTGWGTRRWRAGGLASKDRQQRPEGNSPQKTQTTESWGSSLTASGGGFVDNEWEARRKRTHSNELGGGSLMALAAGSTQHQCGELADGGGGRVRRWRAGTSP